MPGSWVVLESGRRTGAFLGAVAEVLPDRDVAVCRELTKVHEEVEVRRAADWDTEPRKGEVVLVVGPGDPVVEETTEVEEGAGLRAIAAALASRWGTTKREAYNALLALEKERS